VNAGRRRALGLVTLFGTLAFVQSFTEPTEGLPAQPSRALLKAAGGGGRRVTGFVALLAIPWVLKPLYGLLSDLVPLAGSRRKGYLIATAALAAAGFSGARVSPASGLLGPLLVSTLAVAFADVVADALMIEVGGPLGMIGRLQAAQWAAFWGASIVAGKLGGVLSEPGWPPVAFAICGGLSLASMAVAVAFVRDPPRLSARDGAISALRAAKVAVRSPGLRVVGAFLFLWNFNPFSSVVLYLHLTEALGFGERQCGDLQALYAVACLFASLVYGSISRRVPRSTLIRASIPLGIVSNLAYWTLAGPRSAVVVTLFAGFAYMTATLIQLDLAASSCPPEAAGTVFATLMALENLAASLSISLGGVCYEAGADRWGARGSFLALVALGSAFTAGCWFLLPWLPRERKPSGDAGISDESLKSP